MKALWLTRRRAGRIERLTSTCDAVVAAERMAVALLLDDIQRQLRERWPTWQQDEAALVAALSSVARTYNESVRRQFLKAAGTRGDRAVLVGYVIAIVSTAACVRLATEFSWYGAILAGCLSVIVGRFGFVWQFRLEHTRYWNEYAHWTTLAAVLIALALNMAGLVVGIAVAPFVVALFIVACAPMARLPSPLGEGRVLARMYEAVWREVPRESMILALSRVALGVTALGYPVRTLWGFPEPEFGLRAKPYAPGEGAPRIVRKFNDHGRRSRAYFGVVDRQLVLAISLTTAAVAESSRRRGSRVEDAVIAHRSLRLSRYLSEHRWALVSRDDEPDLATQATEHLAVAPAAVALSRWAFFREGLDLAGWPAPSLRKHWFDRFRELAPGLLQVLVGLAILAYGPGSTVERAFAAVPFVLAGLAFMRVLHTSEAQALSAATGAINRVQ